ncbi:MAG: N-acetylmuramoyl-L-alanine amidase [Roseburia sp.]
MQKIKRYLVLFLTVVMMGQCAFEISALAEQNEENASAGNQEQTEETEEAEGAEKVESGEDASIVEEQEAPVMSLQRDIVVVLDPGHGGSDGGACRGSYVERDLALSIAYYCKEELEKYPGVTVYMTRTDNSSECMGRDERAEFAWEKDADLLVSFHLNATGSTSTTQTGAEVYYPNSNYNPAIGSLGYRAASSILTELCGLGLANNGCKTRMSNDTYYFDGTVADYLGINYWSKIKGFPGVLIEHAYINNPSDRDNYLSSEEQLKALGVADATGIMNYFYQNEDAYITHTGSWEHDDGGWWYKRRDGSYPCNCWEWIDGRWFYFNNWGYLCTGWQELGGYWYYLGTRGMMATGWQKVGDKWYYLSPDSGAMENGWVNTDGQWYFLYPGEGYMATGWLYHQGVWYFLQPGSGNMATGWRYLGGKWYYFDQDGAMLTGWYEVDGKWYYSYAKGDMAKNTWIGGYFVGPDGAWIP